MYDSLKKLNVVFLDKNTTEKQIIKDSYSQHFNNFYISNSPEHTINFFRNDYSSEKAHIDAIIFNIKQSEDSEIEKFIKGIRTVNEDIPLILNIEDINKVDLLKNVQHNISGCINHDFNKEVLLKKLHICVQNHKKHKYVESQKKELEKIIKIFNNVALVSKTDKKGVITYVNDIFAETSGYTREELIGKPQSIVRHPDISKEFFKKMWETIQKGNSWIGSIKNLSKDKIPYFVKATIFPICDDEGNVLEYASIRFLTTHEEQIKREFRKKVIICIRDFRKKEFLYEKIIKELESKINSGYEKALEQKCIYLEETNQKLKGRIDNLESQIKDSKNQDSKSVNNAVSRYRSISKELDVMKNKCKTQTILADDFRLELIKKEELIQKLERDVNDKNLLVKNLQETLEKKENLLISANMHNNQLKKRMNKKW